MGCQHLDEVYELFLLGTLVGDEAATVREHVEKRCEYCFERLREAAQTVYFLCQPVRPSRLDPKLKASALRRLRKR